MATQCRGFQICRLAASQSTRESYRDPIWQHAAKVHKKHNRYHRLTDILFSLDIIMRNEIVEKAKPGDQCIFTGSLIGRSLIIYKYKNLTHHNNF